MRPRSSDSDVKIGYFDQRPGAIPGRPVNIHHNIDHLPDEMWLTTEESQILARGNENTREFQRVAAKQRRIADIVKWDGRDNGVSEEHSHPIL